MGLKIFLKRYDHRVKVDTFQYSHIFARVFIHWKTSSESLILVKSLHHISSFTIILVPICKPALNFKLLLKPTHAHSDLEVRLK